MDKSSSTTTLTNRTCFQPKMMGNPTQDTTKNENNKKLFKKVETIPSPLVTRQQQRIEFSKHKSLVESLTTSMTGQLNDLKQTIIDQNKVSSDATNQLNENLNKLILMMTANEIKEHANSKAMNDDKDVNNDVTNVEDEDGSFSTEITDTNKMDVESSPSTECNQTSSTSNMINQNGDICDNLSTQMADLNFEMKNLVVKNLPNRDDEDTKDSVEDENGTKVVDVEKMQEINNDLTKKVNFLIKCVNNLNERNREATIHIINLERKVKERSENNFDKNDNKKEGNDKSTPKKDLNNKDAEHDFVPDEEEFPAIKKSYSTKTNKPRGRVIQNNDDIFTNTNMNGARVVTSKRKNKPNYREMLEKSVIDEISKVDKTNVVQKNKNTITMTTKDDLQETIMFEMKRTFGVVTKHER